MIPVKENYPKADSLNMNFESFDIDDVEKAIFRLNIDTSVKK